MNEVAAIAASDVRAREVLGGRDLNPASFTGLNPPPETPDQRAVLRAAQAFEAVFLHKMLQAMRATVPQTSLMGEDSRGVQIFRDMFDEAVAQDMSTAGGIGLAAQLYNQMSRSLPAKT